MGDAFARELADVNRRRMRVLAPLMLVLHAVHLWLFSTGAAQRATLSADVLRWRDGIAASHALMIPLALVVCAIVWRARSERLLRIIGPLSAAAWLLHAASCTAFDQIVVQNVSVWMGYALGIAVITALSPRVAIPAYAVAFGALVYGLFALQRSSTSRAASLPTITTVTLVSVALSWILHAARKREFDQRLTIDRQRAELEKLNASLEKRVADAVAQLQAQVKARSGELSLALARLAQQRGSDGNLRPGAILGGRFEVDVAIGAGGMGAVYAGRDQSTGARVAIKVIQASSSRQLDALRRFLREAGAQATVSHPAVVRILYVDVSDDGMLFQVQELIEGEPLTRSILRPWSAGDAARLVAVLAEALAAAHAEGVVHRDVKPDNLMLTAETPGLKLLDFGIAKLYDAVSRADDSTGAGMILGTPAYMAPEQVKGEPNPSDRADVYATGILLYRLLAGRLPFDAERGHEMMMRHVMAEAPDPRTVEPSVPAPLAELTLRCLAKEAAARPSAAELARALAELADGAGSKPLAEIARDAVRADQTTPHKRLVTPPSRASS
jgi:serine/threonine-protein kinase